MRKGILRTPRKMTPFDVNTVNDITFGTPGAEASHARTLALQFSDQGENDLAVRGWASFYWASDAAGDVPCPGPTGGVAVGTDGTVYPGDGRPPECLLTKGTLAIHSTPEQFKTTTTALYRVGGAQYSKAAATGLTFSAAHTVTASKYGVVLVQVNAAGTVSTKVPASTQAYNSAALALAALPSPDAGNVALGYIAIANNAGDWVANTDDLTNGSDLTTATFVDGVEEKAPREFRINSEADGDADLVITEPLARTLYLAARLPDGSVKVSSALTFAG